jgi:hypothetical protein
MASIERLSMLWPCAASSLSIRFFAFAASFAQLLDASQQTRVVFQIRSRLANVQSGLAMNCDFIRREAHRSGE